MSNMIETVEVSRQKERVLTNTENPVKIQHERADHSFLIHRIAPLQKISKKYKKIKKVLLEGSIPSIFKPNQVRESFDPTN